VAYIFWVIGQTYAQSAFEMAFTISFGNAGRISHHPCTATWQFFSKISNRYPVRTRNKANQAVGRKRLSRCDAGARNHEADPNMI
jgi:hypothetical protein